MRMRTNLVMFALLSSVSSGCGSTVTIEDGGGGEGGDAPVPCVEESTPEPVAVSLRVEGPASLVAGRLHVTGTVDGVEGYYVAVVDEGALWLPSSTPRTLEGEARWVPFYGDNYVRIRQDETGLFADLLTPGGGADPVVTSSPLGGSFPHEGRQAFGVYDGRAYFCHRPSPEGDARLVTLGPELGEPTPALYPGCYDIYDHSLASGGLLASWSSDQGGDLHIASMANGGRGVVSFGFAGDGVHRYGNVQDVATGGSRVVFSTDSEDWMLAFAGDGSHHDKGPYARFGPPGPKRLLTVLDQVAFLTSRDAVVAYDFRDLQNPVLQQATAATEWDPAKVSFLAASTDTLLVRDATGQLWSVPRALDGPATPTPVYLGEPTPLPDPCAD